MNTLILCLSAITAAVPVFEAGSDGYACFRIPAIIQTAEGDLLAFAEARRDSCSDTGFIDLVARRSTDQGATWGPMTIVVPAGDGTSGNPAPVVDASTGRILLPFTRNLADAKEPDILTGKAPHRTVWITTSDDHGASWSPAREISDGARREGWRWYATGPCHAIQLSSGRIVVPANHSLSHEKEDWHSHVIYSDDLGETWHVGGVHLGFTNESTIAQLRDGRLYQNMRSYKGTNRRQVSWSSDDGLTWTPARDDSALIEPVCQASVLPVSGFPDADPLVFSNPAAKNRTRMTIRMSLDGGGTWPYARLLHGGPAAYSDLVEIGEGTIGILYERGEKSAYESIVFESHSINALQENIEE